MGYNVFNVMSPHTLQISYDVICEAIRIQEQKLAEEHKSKNQYLEVKVFLEGEKNKYYLLFMLLVYLNFGIQSLFLLIILFFK